MKIFLRVMVLVSVILTSKAIVEEGKELKYKPALAMRCGKCTQHRNTETGEWISDASGVTDCMENQDEMLAYCKAVYPTLNITNVIQEDETVHVPSWCHIGSTPPCGGHSHNVKPITCVVGEYEPEAVEVNEGCTFKHTLDDDICRTSTDWKVKAASICHDMGKTVTNPEVLKACEKVDHWQGIQYLCCDPPSLPKPKHNKGKAKKAPAAPLKPSNIETVDKGSATQVCSQPAEIGLCRAYIPRWHFNSESNECETFHWGGCGGNDNNFESKEDCESRCLTEKPTESATDDRSFCGLPSVTGPCRAMFRRYAYDASTGRCKMFVFGGCMENENNFEDEETCEMSCKGYKNPETGPIQIEPPMRMEEFNPIFNLGPVILDANMPTVPPVQVSTEEPPTTTEQQPYTDSTTIANEHEVFADKLKQIKEEHQGKVTKILAKYDADTGNLSSDGQKFQQLKQDLEDTIASLEDEYDAKMSSLNEFHMNRMDSMITDERTKALEKFLKQLKSKNPRVRHILTSLEKYIEVEQQDKSHVMQHYFMAVNDNFDEASITDFKNQLNEIDARVNKTRTVLSNYPHIFKKIQEDVEEILSTMPASPDFESFDEDYGDYDSYEDVLDEEVVDPTPTEMIDYGGIPDPDDICSLPVVVGLCRASMMRYYYDKSDEECKVFYYGGCGGNENSFFTLEECETACISKTDEFDNIDVNGVLDSEEILPREDEFDTNNIDFSSEKKAQEAIQINDFINQLEGNDDNYILTSIENEIENGIENEDFLDSDVDSRFSYNGDPIGADGPQALVDQYKAASISQSWALWVGVGTVVLMIVVVVVVFARRYNSRRPPVTISVEKPEDDGREMSPEEKQLLALQQNGYENPTYKFFEKQHA